MIEAVKKDLCEFLKGSPRGYSKMLSKKYPNLESILRERYGDSMSVGEMLYSLYYNDNINNECNTEGCSNTTSFKQFSHGYYDYCSYSCRAKSKKSYMNVHKSESAKEKAIAGIRKSAKKAKQKREKTCLERYGKKSYSKTKGFGEQIQKTMEERYGTPIAQYVNLSEEQKSLLNPSSRLLKSLLEENKSPEWIANQYDVSLYSVMNRAHKDGLIQKKEWKGQSTQERQIATIIEDQGFEVLCNDKNATGLELDIFVPEKNIAIEYCGLYWHSTRNKRYRENKHLHYEKYKACIESNITLLTIFSDEWINKKNICTSRILHALGKTSKVIYARNTTVQEIESKIGREFFNKNHIAGACNSSTYIALMLDDEPVAVMSFGAARYRKEAIELHRFATKAGMSVVGGASKLLKHYVTRNSTTSNIVSYSDNRWGNGAFYNSLGFTLISENKPSYFYTDKPGSRRWHRSRFQKHRIIEEFNASHSQTEEEIMKENGYYRIYDCGSKTWVYDT